jgi:membrane glycosyltransferase
VWLGSLLARTGLLTTPEEIQPPQILARRDALLREAQSPPEDGLRWLASDTAARLRHLSGNLPPPTATAGHPDADRLTARQKLIDAQSLDQAIGWLTQPERMWVAADPLLLEELASIRAAGERPGPAWANRLIAR